MPQPDNLRITQFNLEIAGACNYSCPSCPQANNGREKNFRKIMPFPLIKKVLDDARQYGVESVSLHGSGEPTLHKELPAIVRYVREQGFRPSFFTNGERLTPALFREVAEAGLDLVTVSMIGYNREMYKKWMSTDRFDQVYKNLEGCLEIKRTLGLKTQIHTRHLILDANNSEYEVGEYKRNVIDALPGLMTEIWLMHSWDGTFDAPYKRGDLTTATRRTCGRPFAPYLEVRAGGNWGKQGAVVPCPFILGKDSTAVLGHLEDQTIAEVVRGEPYRKLREAHLKGDFDSIPYCKGCDQLLEVPEALVWTNIPGRTYGQGKTVPDLDYRNYTS
jgi:organic radical activating enzyme